MVPASPPINTLIYHKFYDRYGYVTGSSLFCDLLNNSEIQTNITIRWKDDGSGLGLPGYADSSEIEIADLKHHIRKANE